jgi:hypothetical protein
MTGCMGVMGVVMSHEREKRRQERERGSLTEAWCGELGMGEVWQCSLPPGHVGRHAAYRCQARAEDNELLEWWDGERQHMTPRGLEGMR